MCIGVYMNLAKIKGTKDIIGEESRIWQTIEKKVRETAKSFDLEEIRTPVIEYADVFKRAIGTETDIVSKEMFEFTDRGGRDICLRPEGTAGVVRAVVESGLHRQKENRFFYTGPMFRAEKPQKGRQRQFHQIGIEIFGDESPYADLDAILFNLCLFETLGLKKFHLKINSVGCSECRPGYMEALREYLKPHIASMCPNCQKRYETNLMRVLDCGEKHCHLVNKNAPSILDYLCSECDAHFEQLKQMLDTLEQKYEVDPQIVRGLDYYNRTAFEFRVSGLGAQNTICGGGRYDGLVGYFDPKNPQPGVGSAIGVERLILALEQEDFKPEEKKLDFYIITAPEIDRMPILKLTANIRRAGNSCLMDHSGKSISRQMKEANKKNARKVLIFGEEEERDRTVVLKDMLTGKQQNLMMEEFLSYLNYHVR
jgi:histidyl-tRNA synthetase